MPKLAKELGALAVRQLKAQGTHSVGGVAGLYLQIKGGSKSWLLRVKVGDKRCEIGLGAYPETSLVDARAKATELREQVKQGIDPLANRHKQAAANAQAQNWQTFDQCAASYIDTHRPGWKNAKHASQWENTLKTYASPVFGGTPIDLVQPAQVVQVLAPIWLEKPETARRVANRVKLVLQWAAAMGLRPNDNPAARERIIHLLPKAQRHERQRKHHPAVQVEEAGAFMAALRALPQSSVTHALQFIMLTACRSEEVRAATWDEIDLDAGLWTIGAARMKAGRPHEVPLPRQALELLQSLPRMASTNLLFPSPVANGVLTPDALAHRMKDLGFKDKDGRLAVPHGLRSTFRDWAEQHTTGFSREAKEAALSHSVALNDTEAAYLRSTLTEQRRPLMAQWANWLDNRRNGAEVIPLHRKTG